MNRKITKASAGKKGETVRSDCYIGIEIKRSGGLKIELQSKVKTMYGTSIKKQIKLLPENAAILYVQIVTSK